MREAPALEQIYGREAERDQLTRWLVEAQCRLVCILGIGGLGKTTLAAQTVRGLAEGADPPFARILWRSLLNAPPLADILPEVLYFLAMPDSPEIPERLDRQLSLLLDYLSRERCLLVLDNMESILEGGDRAGRYRPGYEDYGQLLQYLGQHEHQSCLLLTSRERPNGVGRLERSSPAVRSLELSGLSTQASHDLLQQQGLLAEPELEAALVSRYSGHPLALMLVAETIDELYFGDVAAFLAEETLIFDDIRDVLDQHFARLSPLEQEIMIWLAIEREPITAQALSQQLLGPVNRRDYLEALRALQRRSLLQSYEAGLGLQNVVTEYTTERFVDQICQELENDILDTFKRYPLFKAQTRDYVRESQRRLILKPVSQRLTAQFGQAGLGQKLRRYLDRLRTEAPRGYAGGNILNWLLDLEGELAGLDFSGLAIWQAYLQGKTLHDLDFSGVDFKEVVFTDTFDVLISVAFSPDGTLLAAGTMEGQIRLWRTSDWQPLQTWKVSADHIYSLCFSPDGQTLASSDGSGLVHLWDVTNPLELGNPQPLQTFTGGVEGICFSPDGRLLASGTPKPTSDNIFQVQLWDLSSGQPIQTLEGHTAPVRSVCFSPDGRLLASGSIDQTIRLWDVATGQTVQTCRGHTDWVTSVCFSPDGQTLASRSLDQTIRLWDVTNGQPGQIFQDHRDGFEMGYSEAACFSPDGQTLASGSRDGAIRLWDPISGQVIQTCRGHTDQINSVCFSLDGQTLASSSFDQTIRLWDVANPAELVSGRPLQTFQGYRYGARFVCFSPDGGTLASGDTDGLVCLWDASGTRAQPLRTLAGHTSSVVSMSFSQDGGILASGGANGVIHLWDLTQANDVPLQILERHRGWVRSLCFSPDGQTLVSSGSSDRTIYLWDVASGQAQQTLPGIRNQITSLCLSPDGQTLAGSTYYQLILLWDLTTGQIVRTYQGHPGRVWSVVFSPDGRLLASGGDEGLIQLWDATGQSSHPQQTLTGHTGQVRSVRFSPDGQTLASSGYDQIIRLWDLSSGQTIRTMAGHTDRVRSVSFSPDGQTLASGSDDGTVKFWDVQSGDCLSTRRPARPYERMKIGGVTGLTPAQIAALKELGAVGEDEQS